MEFKTGRMSMALRNLFAYILLIVVTVLIFNLDVFYTIDRSELTTEKIWITETGRSDIELNLHSLRKHILQPSEGQYNFSGYARYDPDDLISQDFQPSDSVQVLERILRTMSPGFFLECGANDGIFVSNTLWLERKLNWTGLLIEPDPNAFAVLRNIGRKSWISNACVSNSTHSYNASFYLSKYSEASGLKKSEFYQATTEISTTCFPFHLFLQVLNVFVVDFLTLHVEGNELHILHTIPFDKITFKVLTIEYLFVPGKRQALKNFMQIKGYRFFRSIVTNFVGDYVFLHPSVVIPQRDVQFIGHE